MLAEHRQNDAFQTQGKAGDSSGMNLEEVKEQLRESKLKPQVHVEHSLGLRRKCQEEGLCAHACGPWKSQVVTMDGLVGSASDCQGPAVHGEQL